MKTQWIDRLFRSLIFFARWKKVCATSVGNFWVNLHLYADILLFGADMEIRSCLYRFCGLNPTAFYVKMG